LTRLEGLNRELVQVILLGPGFGESVLVRVPGNPPGWLVADSFLSDRRGSARSGVLDVLEQLEAEPDLVLLTHPHADHSGGMAALVEQFNSRAAFGVLQVDFATSTSARVRRAAEGVETAAALRALTLVQPANRWDLNGPARELGEGTVTVLHPSAMRLGQLLAMKSIGPNRFSSALLIEWRGRSILLGADLERPEWASLLPAGRLQVCNPVKVPHHGSAGAFDKAWAGDKSQNASNAERRMLIAPFDKHPRLPDIDSINGLPALLAEVDQVHLTSLPFRTTPRAAGAVTLMDLRALRDAAARPTLPSVFRTTGPTQATPIEQEAWLLAELDELDNCAVRGGDEHVALLL
jgi:beta-lactamase superfamily II metal-dependent hydrolase